MIILAACARRLIRDANAVQLQASPSETLELTAVFDATLVFHVWQTIWHTSLIHTGHTEEAFSIKTMWTAAADLLADEPSWIVLQLNSQTTLSGYVALDPADKVPDSLWTFDGNMESPGWFAVSTPARSMLLMVAMVIRVLKTSHAAPSIDTCTKLAAKELMGNIQQIRSRQISTPAATQQLPSAQLKALRTSLLLLKPACLLTSAQTQVSGLPIWSAAASSCVKAYKHGRDTSSRQRAAEAAEVLNLTIHLVQMTVSALKRFIAVKTSAVTAAVPYCCQLLTCLMPEDQPTLHKAVATELIQSGTDHAHFTRPTVHCTACSTPDQIAL
jgi:hypothetical protein